MTVSKTDEPVEAWDKYERVRANGDETGKERFNTRTRSMMSNIYHDGINAGVTEKAEGYLNRYLTGKEPIEAGTRLECGGGTDLPCHTPLKEKISSSRRKQKMR